MKVFSYTIILGLLLPFVAFAQSNTQNIKGQVRDLDTQQPLTGVEIRVQNLEPPIGAFTDEQGYFILENVPIGRRAVVCRFPGYRPYVSDNFILNSAKEQVLEINMSEGVGEETLEEVTISATTYPTQAVNELSVVSTRSFSAEETDRFAASVNDPGRMALSYPGVQQGGDENENDIIVRGNSSYGVLWRLEGIDIPNPNHFARPGTSGGGITVFSAQLLDRSDFSSGGMPAEYGNAIAGAYDVRFRKGNMDQREYKTGISLLGLDFSAEGPFKKGQSSYLFNYRYSTLSLLNRAGVHIVGERVDNDFQDFSFNIARKSKDGLAEITWFGLGGLSQEHYRPVENHLEREPGRANHYEDRDRDGNMGATGFTYKRLLDEKSYVKGGLAFMGQLISFEYDELHYNDSIGMDERFRYNTENYYDYRIAASLFYVRKFSPKTRIKAGTQFHQVFYSFYRQALPRTSLGDLTVEERNQRIDVEGDGNTQIAQLYAQLSHKITPKLSINAGTNLLYLNLNQKATVDPRISLQYKPNAKNGISLAYGIHSQTLPLGLYYYRELDTENNVLNPNLNLDMIRSHHLILGYNLLIGDGTRLITDVYFQRLFQVPVISDGNGQFDTETDWWMLNNQSGVASDPLVSEGKGMNYGINVSLERYFLKSIFFLLNGSLFESKYELPDGREFNTRFGTRFGTSLTLGKESTFGDGKNILQYGARALLNGGMRYTPVDWAALDHWRDTLVGNNPALYHLDTDQNVIDTAGAIVSQPFLRDASRTNESFVQPYFRIDARISWRSNTERFSSILSLDVQNVLNQRNSRSIGWNGLIGEITYNYHNSSSFRIVPVISWRLEF